ncbi:type I secretion system permease/ATPase [Thalassospira sp. NFXS8]|uniref:type I secretion system permease/ATPase n=1 Tax=Thalassospira sp. NFXS8 TaxID=2819093 RepID=UPI0032DE87EF
MNRSLGRLTPLRAIDNAGDEKTKDRQELPPETTLPPARRSGKADRSPNADEKKQMEDKPAFSADADTPKPGVNGPKIDYVEQCLVYLCRHHDMSVTANYFRNIADGNKDITPQIFAEMARKVGLACIAGEFQLETLSHVSLPVAAFLDDGKVVVIVSREGPHKLAVYDPDYGDAPVIMPIADLRGVFSGLGIAVRPYFREKQHVDHQLAKRGRHWFWSALGKNKPIYLQVIIAAALTNFLSLTVSLFTMVVYDRILPNEAIDSLIAMTFGVGFAICFDFVIKMLRAHFIDRAGIRADQEIGSEIFDHLLDMQMKDRRGSSGAFANTLREFETLREFFTSASLVALVDIPFIILFLFVIYGIGGPLVLIPALAVPTIILVGIGVQPLLARYAQSAFEEGQTKQGVLVETISGLETVKTSGAARLMRQRWKDSLKFQAGVGARSRRISHMVVNMTATAQQVSQIGIVVFGVFLIAAGETSMGALVGSVILVGRALAPLGQIAQTLTRLNQVRTSYRNLDGLMKQSTERQDGRHYLARARLAGRIEFQNVNFSYPGQNIAALRDVSFVIEPGEKVAILGRIGSGKSTILRLMLGLYEPDSGSILVDGTDIRQIDPSDLRANISAVLQDAWLFSGSVKQNIAVGAYRPNDDDILRAASLSGAHDFISRHPSGYDLMIQERGEGLSGGQRQSISLARGLVGAPPILLMDEPTSMMDMQTEQIVVNRLRTEAEEQTILVVTHRPSMLDMVDTVIVVEGGAVVARGPKSIVNKKPPTSTETSESVETSSPPQGKANPQPNGESGPAADANAASVAFKRMARARSAKPVAKIVRHRDSVDEAPPNSDPGKIEERAALGTDNDLLEGENGPPLSQTLAQPRVDDTATGQAAAKPLADGKENGDA